MSRNAEADRLEREVEETRAHIADTLDALHAEVNARVDEVKARLDPETLKRQAKDYARERAHEMAANVGSSLGGAVARHPAAAVALGAAASWPFLKMAAKIPLPVYMIGAGVALMRPLDGSPPLAGRRAGRATMRMQHRMEDAAESALERGAHARETIAEAYSEAASGVRHAASGAAEAVGGAAASLRAGAREAAESVAETGEGLMEAWRERRTPPNAYRSGAAYRDPGFADGAGPNPWALALVALGLGAGVASYVPKMLEEERRKREMEDMRYRLR
ncbi:DUF3618 domain-containing protein [Faunimonas sp. B44]|uniref:DUF3618 domain-containing protein n=1 Tax=Faunimonas sp. B44 TaxID=3461493 RepID=UPI00404472C4